MRVEGRAGIVAGAVAVGIVVQLGAQSSAPKGWAVPRTAEGRPDIQGVWANNTITPLERPKQFEGRATMTEAEFALVKTNAQKLLDGGDAFFFDELFTAARGRQEQVHLERYADRQLRPDVAVGARVRQADLAHHRPAGRAVAPPAPGFAERAQARARGGSAAAVQPIARRT